MEIAIIHDNQIIKIGHYKKIFSDTSFPTSGPDEKFMSINNAVKVTNWKPYDISTQNLIMVEPYLEDQQVFTVSVVDKTADEISLGIVHISNTIRTDRNKLLQETDWTQLNDSKVDAKIWAKYRQSLRDITLQVGFPTVVTWPSIPSSIWSN